MALQPLGNAFLFEFLEDTADGKFVEQTRSGIILTNQDCDHQGQWSRWVRVLAIGPQVIDFSVDDIVLVENGMWTRGFDYEERRMWRSDDTKVIAIGDDASVAFAY